MTWISTLVSLLCRLAAAGLLVGVFNSSGSQPVTARPAAPSPQAPSPANVFAVDPDVAAMMAQVTQDAVYDYTAQLSGAAPATVGGQPYTFVTRSTDSGVPIQKATQFAFEHLQAAGLTVSYFQWSDSGLNCRNVVAVLTGTVRPNEIVLVTAHLDSTSDSSAAPGAAPGADDNASGSTGVLVAAGIMSPHDFERTVRFILFTGEEQDVLGSYAYAQAIHARGENVVAVYNMDMIGYDSDGDGRLLLHTRRPQDAGYAGDMVIAGVLTNVVSTYGLGTTLAPAVRADGEDASDHWSFWDQGYAAVLAIEDDWDDFNEYYHSSDDLLKYLNLPYFTAFVQASVGTAAHLAVPVSAPRWRTYLPLMRQ
jgi:Zn-dependent M28 family amino/carboxypeptidase